METAIGPRTLESSRLSQIIINLFIIFYWLLVFLNIMPPCLFKSFFQSLARPLQMFAAIDQGWTMFCPDMRLINFHCYALITYADGLTAYYEFPRMERMSFKEALQRERSRKFVSDLMPWEGYKAFRRPVAQYLARSFDNPVNHPAMVSLCWNWVDIPPFKKCAPRDHLPPHSHQTVFFTYKVKSEDLTDTLTSPQ